MIKALDSLKRKIGRKASAEDREHARHWAALYRSAQRSPDGLQYLGDSSASDKWPKFVDINDARFLVSMLEGFAKNGTFAFVDEHGFEALFIRDELKTLRTNGKTHEIAIAELAEKYHCSISTIERTVRMPSKRDAD